MVKQYGKARPDKDLGEQAEVCEQAHAFTAALAQGKTLNSLATLAK
jgi:hypothetical protein